MALPALAAPADLAAWMGQDIPAGDARAWAVLSAASALVRAEAGQTWVNNTNDLTGVPDEVAAIVVQVAARVWANPTGAVQWTKGPFSERYSDDAALGLYLTDAEKSALSRYRSAAPSGLGVLSTTRGDDYADTVYVPTGPPPSGYPFPWYDADDPVVWG
jgi:hypothetical protein